MSEGEEMLYKKFYKRLEGARWNMHDDIPWQEIDRTKITRDQLEFVKSNALIEWTAVDATEAFLRDFSHDSDFSSFISIWYYEEMKHFLVLKKYVEHLGLEITVEECQKMRSQVKPSTPANILTVHFIGEFRLALWYNTLRRFFQEPVLKEIYRIIAQDEIRHGICYYHFLKELIKKNSKEKLTVLKTSLFMLRRPVHPTMITGTVSGLEGADRVYAFLNKAVDVREKEATHKKVLKYLSRICNSKLEDMADILRHTRQLRAQFSTG